MTEKDQKNINEFSRLNKFMKELQAENTANKEMLNRLEDAETELDLADEDEPIAIQFGSCFIRASIEDS